MAGKLIIVGTPIGNLSDFSPRAIETLETCDFIAAEDTRVTVKLLNHFGIKKPMVSYFEHNKMERGDIICNRMEQGEVCVLVSDAGMPAISDPGELLVAQCVQRNIPVYVVPGPTAVISALAVSGLPTGRFTVEGFLSTTLKEAAQSYSNENAKGELVLVIEGAEKEKKAEITIEEAVEKAKRYMQDGMSASEASKTSAQETGCKKGDIYRLLNME